MINTGVIAIPQQVEMVGRKINEWGRCCCDLFQSVRRFEGKTTQVKFFSN